MMPANSHSHLVCSSRSFALGIALVMITLLGGAGNALAAKPNLNANADATGTAGVAFTYPIQATNPPILSYAASGLPAGLTVDIATGLISGTPTTPGTYPVALSATN